MSLPFTNFSSGVTSLPAYSEVANEKLVLIVHAWDSGSASAPGPLQYDNTIVAGSATCGAMLSIGDQVFADLNATNLFESGTDAGISGLNVELLSGAGQSFSPAITTTTNPSGLYSFNGLPQGTFRVKVTPNTTYPLAVTSVTLDNGVNHDSNGVQTIQGQPALSPVITLASGTEPGSAGGGNVENTIDFGFKACSPITLNPGTLAVATVGSAYTQNVTATGGTAPYNYTVSSGSLPVGLNLNAATGAITGTPTSASTATFTISASDAFACVGTRSYTLTPVCPAMSISPVSLPLAYVSQSYNQVLTISGGVAPFTWTVGSGALPAGLSLTSAGTVQGTPTAAGASTFTVIVTDTNGCSASIDYTLSSHSLGLGNLIWSDTNNDGLRGSNESGIPTCVSNSGLLVSMELETTAVVMM